MLFDIKPHDESLSRLLYTNGEPDTFVVESLKSICYNFIYRRVLQELYFLIYLLICLFNHFNN